MKISLRTYSLKLAVKAPNRVSLTVRRANVPTLSINVSKTVNVGVASPAWSTLNW